MSWIAAINPLLLLSGFCVGLLVGQTGVGGGSLMTPILVLGFGVHPATAVGTDLLYASATQSVGTLVHGLNHTVDWRIVRRLAAGSVPAALAALLAISHYGLAKAGSGGYIAPLLGTMLLLTALSLIFRQYFLRFTDGLLDRITPVQAAVFTVIAGAVIGAVVTLTSVGAGAIGVTALLMLYPRRPLPVIIGSDIAHAVPLTLLAGVGHWWLGSLDWPMLGSLLSGSIPGIVLGSYLSGRIPDSVLRTVLALVLCGVGGRLLF